MLLVFSFFEERRWQFSAVQRSPPETLENYALGRNLYRVRVDRIIERSGLEERRWFFFITLKVAQTGATARAKSKAIVDGWLDCFVDLEGFDADGEVGFGGVEGGGAAG
jgi:hypothetical protein